MPDEILLLVFEYLSAIDLIALSKLGPTFCNLISDLKLVKKLSLYFGRQDGDGPIGIRQYEQLKIHAYFYKCHYRIIQDIGTNLVTLSIMNHKLKLNSLRAILVGTPNVRNLSLERVTLSDVPRSMKLPLPRLQDVSLKSKESDPRLYQVLRNCNFNEISISQQADDGFYRFKELDHLLRSLTALKSLSFDRLCKTSLFDEDILSDVNFQLEHFSVTDSVLNRTVHLKEFIESHAATLKRLEISKIESCDLSTVLNKLENLSSLSLRTVDLRYLGPMVNVEELSLTGHKITETAWDKFPSIRKLKLVRIKKKTVFTIISRTMLDLQDLEVKECKIAELKVPSIKRLSLHTVFCPTEFFNIHCNIEHLSMVNCFGVTNNTIKEIAQSLHRLKTLTIIKSDITDDGLLLLRDYCDSLRELRIAGNPLLDWRLLEDRKEIKVYIS